MSASTLPSASSAHPSDANDSVDLRDVIKGIRHLSVGGDKKLDLLKELLARSEGKVNGTVDFDMETDAFGRELRTLFSEQGRIVSQRLQNIRILNGKAARDRATLNAADPDALEEEEWARILQKARMGYQRQYEIAFPQLNSLDLQSRQAVEEAVDGEVRNQGIADARRKLTDTLSGNPPPTSTGPTSIYDRPESLN